MVAFAMIVAWSATTYAQERAPTTSAPELETFAEAEVEPGTLEPGQRVEVVLTIVVDVDGTVGDVEVFEGAGDPFDAAATEAARRLLFAPARRNGEAIAARIRFRYTFDGPPVPQTAEDPDIPEQAEPAEPSPGRIEGALRDPDGQPIAQARVTLDGADEAASRETTTDGRGRFTFTDVAAGRWLLGAYADGFDPLETNEDVIAGEALELTYRLNATAPDESGDAELGVTAEVEPPRREATRRTISGETLTQTAGTRGDALRVIELLPGVARPIFGSGALYIRGAAPGDSEVFVDGASVPLLYHFGGLTSFFNSRLLRRIDFYPGNFSVRFGRRIGGILEVEPRDPQTDQAHAILDVNLLDSSLIIESPMGDQMAMALALRRSYIDFFFSEVVPGDLIDVIAAPVYYDYQLLFTWRPGPSDRLRLMFYGSSDEFATVFGDPEEEGVRQFSLDLRTQFHRGQLSWRHIYDENFQQDVMFAVGWTGVVLGAGDAISLDSEFVPLTFRSEWTLRLHEQVRVRWGLDWTWAPTSVAFRGPAPTQSEGQPMMRGGFATRTDAVFRGQAYRPAIYFESTVQPVEPLAIVTGLRLDYFRDIDQWTFDPRLSARWSITEQWVIKAGLGLFSQPPEFQETADGIGNRDLDPIVSVHSSAGVELNYDRTWRFSIEGYYKHIFDRVVGTEGGVPPFFINDGIGRIYGAEISARANPTPGYPISGLLSYTLSRSERLDRDGDWRLFDFDQTHIFSISVVWNIGDGWQAGASFRLVSGNPFTPVNGAIYDARADLYQAVYGPTNSARNPFFHRLDLRIEKTFIIDFFRLSIYLDVQNVYNAENRELTIYNYDFSESAGVNGLPILPSLGLRGQL